MVLCVFAIATWKSNSKITCNSLFYGYQTIFIHYWAHSLWVNKHVYLIKCSTNSVIDECEYDVLKWHGKGWWTRSLGKPGVGWCLHGVSVKDVKAKRMRYRVSLLSNIDISGMAIATDSFRLCVCPFYLWKYYLFSQSPSCNKEHRHFPQYIWPLIHCGKKYNRWH